MKKIKYIFNIGFYLSIAILVFGLVIGSCQHEAQNLDDLEEVCFNSQILPIFRNSCALSGCHDANSHEEGYILDSYENIIKGIIPYQSGKSELYQSLVKINSDDMMPPDQPLSLENRMLIRIWIDQGANNVICIDTSANPGDTATWINPRACFERDILPIMLSGCAFSGCHDATTAAGETILSDYNNIIKEVRAGDPEESELYQKMIEDNPEDIMPPPPYNPLPQSQIDTIYKWIQYGALNEYCGVMCDTSSEITYSGYIWPIIELSCLSCHSGSSPSGNVSLTNYTQVAAIANDGRFTGVLEGISYPLMPPGNALDDCKINQIIKWIESGSLNN